MNAITDTTNKRTDYSVQVGIVLVSTLILLGLVFFVRKGLTSGLWSFFFYKELPVWLRLFFVVSPALLAVAICYLAKRVSSTTLLERHRIQPYLLLSGICIISFGIFWLLREHRYWGDALGTIQVLEGKHIIKPLETVS